MLMMIWNVIFVLTLVALLTVAAFIFGFYYGLDYANLDEEEVEEMKYHKEKIRLAKVGSWIIEHTHM